MSDFATISNCRPVTAPISFVQALSLDDAYWDCCVDRASEHYECAFSDHGFEITIGELKVDRREIHTGLVFDFNFLFDYEHELCIEDLGKLPGTVYVRVPSLLAFSGLISRTQQGFDLDYKICVQASGIQGFLVDTNWETLGDQTAHVLFRETNKAGNIDIDSVLLKDMFSARTLEDFAGRYRSDMF